MMRRNRTFSKSLTRGWQRVELIPCLLAAFASAAEASSYEDAHLLVQKKKWAEALPLLEKLKADAPSSQLVHQDLAETLIRMNRRAEGIRLFRRFGLSRKAEVAGRAFLTQEGYRLYQEGLNFLDERKWNLARERFERAYERDRDHLDILVRLSQVETLDLRAESALNWIQTARELYGEVTELFIWEGRALSLQKQYPAAIQKLLVAVRDFPRSENAALGLAEAQYAAGEKDAALATIESDLKKNPLHLRVLSQKIRWDLDRFSRKDVTEADVNQELQLLSTRLEKVATSQQPLVFESELGLELFDLDALREDLEKSRTQLGELKKRSAL